MYTLNVYSIYFGHYCKDSQIRFKQEIHKVEGKKQEIFKNFISIPYKLSKSLNFIKEQFPEISNFLPQELLHNALSSIIRIYSKKYTEGFSDKSVKTDQPEPSIKGEIKASIISFLLFNEQ
ncbi:hypothetical protein phytr_12480 [Candidatus Phycorickettsia trachydisci]|uniref:Uncharacterized protein n=1 Tax=Candidatus Phycorickettsia trachydisci TaxID=2115978 RepID=A0A2P1PA55_9RICK|nr:hypothetical protein [Candidatus Phycorickettsia trachydisci]AVP88172.1 hypothetical protein phytr_12480 [Candidatus Phycorickettsia trachydisci]